jgi:hypothetical protein
VFTKQHQRCQDAAHQAGIRADHGILHGVGDKQQHHQVEDRHLA